MHYDEQPERRPAYWCLSEGVIPGGWGVDDGAALVFEGIELVDVVAARPGAGVRRVDTAAGGVVERQLPARLLRPPLRAVDESLAELRELRQRRALLGRI